MKPRLRTLLTATALAALSTLTLAAGALAAPPQPDDSPRPRSELTTQDRLWVCESRHGPQYDCDQAPATGVPAATGDTTTAPAWPRIAAVLSIAALLSVGVALTAGGLWTRLRHRPREAI
jgi:hypothetical protein